MPDRHESVPVSTVLGSVPSGELGMTLPHEHLFNDLSGYTRHRKYDTLLVAPDDLRAGLLALIRRETRKARKGKPAGIRAMFLRYGRTSEKMWSSSSRKLISRICAFIILSH